MAVALAIEPQLMQRGNHKREPPLRHEMRRGARRALRQGLATRACWRWWAPYDGELIIPKGSRMRIDVTPCVDGMEAVLLTRSLVDKKLRMERYQWRNDMLALVEVADLEPPRDLDEDDLDEGDLNDEPPRKRPSWLSLAGWR